MAAGSRKMPPRGAARAEGGGLLRGAPLFVVLMGLSALAMLIPASYGAAVRDWTSARAFVQSALLVGLLTVMIGLAAAGRVPRVRARAQLITLVATFTALPLLLAIPFRQVEGGAFLPAYLEMVSSLTTTGASLWQPHELPDALHLWRATVGWFGGFFVWVTAIAILAPLNLGGFEVIASGRDRPGGGLVTDASAGPAQPSGAETADLRLLRFATRLAPIYGGLTGALWILLTGAGETPMVALCHAMSTLSTSGISPVGGVQWGGTGRLGEVMIFAFFVFAISRRSFAVDDTGDRLRRLAADPEARMGLICVAVLPVLLFLRHFIGATEAATDADLANAARAFWGSAFTVLSFLTTTGFESTDWVAVRNWSGLQTPGLILMGLALVGGGVATTAGGVKLLRVYALYKHGTREMERLVHPSSVGGSGATARRIRRQGALVAWVFFMLFALSLAGVGMALAATGLDFETSVVLAVAALSTCGPLATVAAATPIDIGALEPAAQVILAMAMVLGRLETLALLALLNPGFWRR